MRNFGSNIKNAFHLPSTDRIVLDFAHCRYMSDIHQLLQNSFGFPAYYGANWDALWDCLDGLFLDCGDIVIEIHNLSVLNVDLKEACQPMLDIFTEITKEIPNVSIKLVS